MASSVWRARCPCRASASSSAPFVVFSSVSTMCMPSLRHVIRGYLLFFFFSSRRRHTRCLSDWSSDVCSSDLGPREAHQQLEIDLLRQAAERAVGDRVARLVERHWPQVFRDQAQHLRAHVERSEERRVGKECRTRGWAYASKKKTAKQGRSWRK